MASLVVFAAILVIACCLLWNYVATHSKKKDEEF